MINQALNIGNLYRQSKFEMLDVEEKNKNLEAEAEMFKQFQQEINKENKDG